MIALTSHFFFRKDAIIFRRENIITKETDHISYKPGNHEHHKNAVEHINHPAPEAEQQESNYADADNSVLHKLASHKGLPPQYTCTVFSRRHLNIIPEKKLTSQDKSREYINQESTVPWNLIPLSGAEPYKDITERVHQNCAYLSKDIVTFSQNEANRKINNSQNDSYLPNTRDTHHSEIRSECVQREKSNTDSSKCTLQTVSRDPVSCHFLRRDEYKSYSKCKSEINLYSKNKRSKTHSIKASSEHHSHSKRWESYRIPRKIRETSVSRALRNLRSRSRSRSVSRSRTVPGPVSTIAKQRYDNRASSQCRSFLVTDTSDKHADQALKLADSQPPACYLNTQLPKDTQIETSKDFSFKPQNKSIQDSEPHSITGPSNAELEYSLKIPQIGPGVKRQTSPCVESTCRNGFATVSNLSEHSSFKRSRRAKIVKFSNSETKPREVTNSDLNKNTNNKLASDHNESGGIKGPLESNGTDKSHLSDSTRQVLDDVTGIKGYIYRENDEGTEHKQKYNGASKNQPSPSSRNETILKMNKVPKDKRSVIQNVDAAVLDKNNKGNQTKEETGPTNIKLDCKDDNDKQPTMENAVKETSGNTTIKSDCPNMNDTNKNCVLKDNDHQYGGQVKFRSDRKLFNTKRKSLTSFRAQYTSQRYRERSSAQIAFNSHCKRRSPSELLNKDRTGRRLHNHNENARTERSRSRSSEEGTSIYRETKRYKITYNADGRNIRHEANKTSSESEKNSRYSRGGNGKLNSSHNYKGGKGKHEVETDKTSHQEEDSNRNVQNMRLLGSNRSKSVMSSDICDDPSGHTKWMGRTNSCISIAFNKKQNSDKVLQHEVSILSVTNPAGLNEIAKTSISEINPNYFLRSNSAKLNTKITTARHDSCERGSQVLRMAESNTSSENTNEKCVIYEADYKNEIKKTKKPKDKSKESSTNNSHNNDINKEGNEKNSTEVEQTKQSITNESGKDEVQVHNNNFQKENLLESRTKDNVMDGYCSLERLETQKSGCMEEQQHESSKQPVTEPLASGQIIEAGGPENSLCFHSKSSSVESVQLRDRKCEEGRAVIDSLDETCIKKINNGHPKNRRNKLSSSDNAEGNGINNVINVTKNKGKKMSNRKAKSGRHEECGETVNKSSPDTNKGSIMKSKIDNVCRNPIGSTVKGMEDVIQIVVNEVHNTGVKEPQHGSFSQDISEQSVCDEANKTGKAKKMVTCSRSRPSDKKERVFKEKETNKCCERTENEYKKNISDICQSYDGNNGENTQSTLQVSQTNLINAKGTEMRRKYESYSKAVQPISATDKNTEDGVMKSKLFHECIRNIKAAADEVKDTAPNTINEKLKSHSKDFKHGSSDNHTTKPSLASNENENNRTRRLRRSDKDDCQLMRPQKHKMADSIDETCVKFKTNTVKSNKRKKIKFSEDKNKMLSISQKDKELVGKKDFEAEAAQIGADNIKYSTAAREEEEISKNVHKTNLLESSNVHVLTCTKPEIQNCSEGQTESLKGMKNIKINEVDCKERQNGKYREPVTELSSHEVIQKGVVELIPKSVSRDNSVALPVKSSIVSPVINLKFRSRRSVENKLEDSKGVLLVNITPPKDKMTDLIAESPGTSAIRINGVSETQNSLQNT